MNERIGLAAALSASVILAFAAGAALTHAARADSEAGPNTTTCSSPTPCFTKSNTSSGAGIKSTSAHGTGLVATTNAKGSVSGNGASAILGRDLQSTNGQFNAGVTGTSTNGVGVQGTSSGGFGVQATSQGTAVNAAGGSIGVNAVGDLWAVNAETSGAVAVFAHNTNSDSGALIFRGDNNNDNTMFSVDNAGNTTIGGTIMAPFEGIINVRGGVKTSTGTSNAGIQTDGPFFGVYAEVAEPDPSAAGYFSLTDNPQAWLYQGASVFHNRIDFEVADDGTVFASGYGTLSAPRVAQKTSTGRSVDTYTPQISQPALEDFGEAQLVDGVAYVALDSTFSAAINRTAGYLVTVTPEGDCRGLFVAQRTGAGFTVRELQGGRSSIAFSYHVIARPYGSTSARLPASSMPRNFGAPLDRKLLPAQVSRPFHVDRNRHARRR